jgi:hypothetical protein
VLVGEGGRPTILDFGLSSGRIADEEDGPAGLIEGSFAAEVLGVLRGQPIARATALPRLGGDSAVRALVERALANQSTWLVGGPGTGRTRCLAEAAEALERAGRKVIRLKPSPFPYASLLPVIGALPDEGELDAIHAMVGERLLSGLARGVQDVLHA